MSEISILLSSDNATYNDDGGDFTFEMNNQMNFSAGWELCFRKASFYYSWYNISQSLYNNHILKYYNGSTWKTVTFRDGIYRISDINTELQKQILINGDVQNKIKISANYTYNRVEIFIESGSGYKLDMQSSVSNMYLLLGYNSQIIENTDGSDEIYHLAENRANMVQDFESLILHVDIIDRRYSYNGSQNSDVLTIFLINDDPGSLINLEESNLLYLPITKSFDSIRIYITDTKGRTIKFNGEKTTIFLSLRYNPITKQLMNGEIK